MNKPIFIQSFGTFFYYPAFYIACIISPGRKICVLLVHIREILDSTQSEINIAINRRINVRCKRAKTHSAVILAWQKVVQ